MKIFKGLALSRGFGRNRPGESEQVTSPRNSSRPNSKAALRPWRRARLLRGGGGCAGETLRTPGRPRGNVSRRRPQLRPRRAAPRAARTSPAVLPLHQRRPHQPPPASRSDCACSQEGSRATWPAAATAAGPMRSAAEAGGGSRPALRVAPGPLPPPPQAPLRPGPRNPKGKRPLTAPSLQLLAIG